MTKFSSSRIFTIVSNKSVILIPVLLVMISACVTPPQTTTIENSNYTTESLAKDWRAQVRKNPNNPFEGLTYPADNDIEYYAPKKNPGKSGTKRPSVRQTPAYNDMDNEDSSYGRFPKYNPDDDNVYSDSKNYPLYQD